MSIRTGIGAVAGRRVGTGVWLGDASSARGVGTVADEIVALDLLVARLLARLDATRARLLDAGAGEAADIVQANSDIVGDPALRAEADRRVHEGAGAAAAFAGAGEHFAQTLEALPDPLIASRATDLRRLAAAIGVSDPPTSCSGTDLVLLGDDFGPADLAVIEPSCIAAIALQGGSALSHAAIVASSLGIPLVVGLGAGLETLHGCALLVDGGLGIVEVDPEDAVVAATSAARATLAAADLATRDLPAVTTDGVRMGVFVNASTAAQVQAGLEAGAEGTGLYRTEFEFLAASEWPDEAAHAAALGAAVAASGAALLTVRTLDFGGDKMPPFVDPAAASFLGVRGIRAASAAPGALSAQLTACRALAASGAYLRVLLPMVTTIEEFREASDVLGAARATVPIGVMIEVPAAALLADVFAAECDFLSIGTNDLTQYTLAADRTLAQVAALVSPYEPSVVRLVHDVAAAAVRHGTPVDVCGEAAGDPRFLALLIGMGVDAVSVAPGRVGSVKRAIRSLDADNCRKALARALEAATRAEVEAALDWVEPVL